ncbi:hypothetical protein [Rickettsia amblyommatis]|uniref:hypothetical protein n=1 Tax=Rickettsia amblyommatis TaxID=33989 RepID=UPI00061E6E11|nr:hypothetical protein [Rickettsia amblyommatis]KJV91341.1 hypothetical protein RAMDARK_1094 [Rickettsia amblyommatis str. Darkwater]
MMTFKILFTIQASKDLKELENRKTFKSSKKHWYIYRQNPRHPSLNTHNINLLKDITEQKYLKLMLKILLLLLIEFFGIMDQTI